MPSFLPTPPTLPYSSLLFHNPPSNVMPRPWLLEGRALVPVLLSSTLPFFSFSSPPSSSRTLPAARGLVHGCWEGELYSHSSYSLHFLPSLFPPFLISSLTFSSSTFPAVGYRPWLLGWGRGSEKQWWRRGCEEGVGEMRSWGRG